VQIALERIIIREITARHGKSAIQQFNIDFRYENLRPKKFHNTQKNQ